MIYTTFEVNSGKTKLTNNTTIGRDYNEPIWSPDGSKIMYSYYNGSQWDVFSMNSNGSSVVNLTNTANQDEIAYDWK
ncbi:MAG: hypothetical protein FJ213_03080 [Ignavibacteria bacterium]|nr:hypothetical protein [Ignavibacteria bacterium]